MLFRQLLVLLCLLPIPAMAADSPVYSHKAKGAVKGADVVAYYSFEPGEKALIGSDAFTYQWGGATWKFVNAENLAAFAANPEAYAPQYGGYCAFAVSLCNRVSGIEMRCRRVSSPQETTWRRATT